MKLRMWRLVLAGLAVMISFAGSADADLTPEQTKTAQVLIAQFTRPEFAVRQKAVEELIKLGRDVLPLIRKTLAETEDPAAAVMREAREETGLDGLELIGFLGESDFPVPERGELHRRRFYHLRCTGEAPSRWEHDEQDPSDGSTEPILFELYWVDLRNGLPALAPGHGRMLPSLLDLLAS